MEKVPMVTTKEDMMTAFIEGLIVLIKPNHPNENLIGTIQMVEWEDGSGESFNFSIRVNGELTMAYIRFKPRKKLGKKGLKESPIRRPIRRLGNS
jgi:hypothetical protein